MQQIQERKRETSTLIGYQKVVSFKNMRDKGVIQIRLLEDYFKTDANNRKIKNNTVTACVFQDPKTQIHYGIPLKKREDGTIQFKRIKLEDGRIFNLEDITDREEWHAVQNWPLIKDSLMDTRGIAHFEVFDKDLDAQKKLEEYKTKRQAEDYIINLSDADLLDFALAFHIDIVNNSPSVVKSLLIESCSIKASNGKNIVLETINNKQTLEATIAFRRAIITGLAKFTSTGFVYKNNVPLGVDEAASIDYLLANKALFASLNAETKAFKNSGNVVNTDVFETPERKLARLKAEASELGVKQFWLLEVADLENAVEEAKTKEAKAKKESLTKTAKEMAKNGKGKLVEPEPEITDEETDENF